MKYRRNGLIIFVILVLAVFLSISAHADGIPGNQKGSKFRIWLYGGFGRSSFGKSLGGGLSVQYNDRIFGSRLMWSESADLCKKEYGELALLHGFGTKDSRYLVAVAVGPGIVVMNSESHG